MSKIQELIDSQVITLQDVLIYAEEHNCKEMQYQHDNDAEWEDDFKCLPSEKYPDYVVVSTSYDAEETFAFPADDQGVITNFGEIAALARRWCTDNGTESDYDWERHDLVIQQLFTDEHKYMFVNDLPGKPCKQSLWKKV